ncbi:MAG: dihydroorotase [Pseudomonadota bacterium]
MKRIAIVNAVIVNEGSLQPGDVFIQNGRIEAIVKNLGARPVDTLIDAKGAALLPGMIDDQVHFREPGLTHKGDIASESRAAVAGGITSYMEMPNTRPPTLDRERLAEKYRLADRRSFANYAFYLGASNDNIEEIKAVDPNTVCGVKVFMGASTGNMLVDDPKALEALFLHAPTLIAAHCEDTPTILENEARYRNEFGDRVPMNAHPQIRSEAACYQSAALAVSLAKATGARLHLLHLSTAREMALLSEAPLEDKRITAEVCVHHLFFTDADYAAKGAFIKCNPAIKTGRDREALLAAVVENKIDVIGTDHAPHTLSEKAAPYFQAPSGLPLVQHALPCLLEHTRSGRFSLPLIAEKTAHAPARLFQIPDRGYIREGYWADLVLVDLHQAFTVDEGPCFYKCGWSPFSGRRFSSTVMATLVSGHLAYHEGRIDPVPAGRRLVFRRR